MLLGLIILLAAVLRLPGLNHGYLLASDTARDILVARGAVTLGQLPWVGSFSSAGPFVFGPNWYWFLMLPAVLAPNFFLGPWVLMFLMSLLFVLTMGLIGRALGGRTLGLITALITAVSPVVLGNSLYLTQHGLVEVFAGLALLGLVLYLRTGRLVFAFLLGLGVGAGFSLHYQAINLFVYFPIVFLGALWQRRSVPDLVKLVAVCTLGAIIFPLPLFLWDITRGFKNLIELVYYFRVGQYRFWVSNRWLTYLGVFWPGFLGKLIGGGYYSGVLSGMLLGLAVTFGLVKKRIPLPVLAVLAVLAIQVFMLRYFRGEKYDGYLIYFHPVLLSLISWAIYELVKLNKFIGAAAVILVIIAGLKSNTTFYTWNNDVSKLYRISEAIQQKFPNEKVVLFGRSLLSSNVSYSLSTVLDATGVGGESGRPVGVCLYGLDGCSTPGAREIVSADFQGENFVVADLGTVPAGELTKKQDWYPFSKLAVYNDVQNWWKKGITP